MLKSLAKLKGDVPNSVELELKGGWRLLHLFCGRTGVSTRRSIKPLVTDALDRQAAVTLIGPRQVGKTTLAQDIAEERGALYLDLEDRGRADAKGVAGAVPGDRACRGATGMSRLDKDLPQNNLRFLID